MIRIKATGSTKRTQSFLANAANIDAHIRRALDEAGRKGVQALASATPVDSGLTANSWSYEIVSKNGRHIVYWSNTHSVSGVNVAIILQFGHGTGTGGWVSGRDYINPAVQPIFDSIADNVWKKVTSA